MPLKKEKREECFSVVLKKFDFFWKYPSSWIGYVQKWMITLET